MEVTDEKHKYLPVFISRSKTGAWMCVLVLALEQVKSPEVY